MSSGNRVLVIPMISCVTATSGVILVLLVLLVLMSLLLEGFQYAPSQLAQIATRPVLVLLCRFLV